MKFFFWKKNLYFNKQRKKHPCFTPDSVTDISEHVSPGNRSQASQVHLCTHCMDKTSTPTSVQQFNPAWLRNKDEASYRSTNLSLYDTTHNSPQTNADRNTVTVCLLMVVQPQNPGPGVQLVSQLGSPYCLRLRWSVKGLPRNKPPDIGGRNDIQMRNQVQKNKFFPARGYLGITGRTRWTADIQTRDPDILSRNADILRRDQAPIMF